MYKKLWGTGTCPGWVGGAKDTKDGGARESGEELENLGDRAWLLSCAAQNTSYWIHDFAYSLNGYLFSGRDCSVWYPLCLRQLGT